MTNPLEALLRPVADYLNRNIGEITPAREICRELDGRVIAVRIRRVTSWGNLGTDGTGE